MASVKKKSPAKKSPAKAAKAAPKKKTAASAKSPKKVAASKSAAASSKKAAGPAKVAAAPKVGAKAPDFSLPADDGREVSLKDLRGKNVVLYFYPRDMTPGCTVEACGFRDADKELAKKNTVVIGVSRDSPETHQKFKTKEKLPFTLLSDRTGDMIAAYGSWGEKSFMGRKSMGILRTTVLIDGEGKVLKVFPKVNTKTHAGDVLEALDELNA